ncbi:MAG: threonylcarbamoyl-AMP synthase [Alphaproteobacteria bacterium]|nr:threonylcarbamoyl-AMP synthase [Alphaproteobacteria bacterium]
MDADPDTIARAGALLRQGRLVAIPTETVYGLAADATNDEAVAAIFAAKDRPRFNPLIVHAPDAAAALALVRADARARRLADAFWPGPLTLVLPRAAGCPVSLLCSAGLDSLAVRVPAHPVATAVLRAAGTPVAAPSANRSGRVSPTTAAHVRAEFPDAAGGRLALVVDGGPCPVGVESTVLDLTESEARLLRPGGAPAEAIEAALGAPVLPAPPDMLDDGDGESARAGALKSPGLLASHYAPARPVRLVAWGEPPRPHGPREALLAFGPADAAGFVCVERIGAEGDLAQAAARLFAAMRALDRPGIDRIAAMLVPETGLGRAINDRLRRAAAPR